MSNLTAAAVQHHVVCGHRSGRVVIREEAGAVRRHDVAADVVERRVAKRVVGAAEDDDDVVLAVDARGRGRDGS